MGWFDIFALVFILAPAVAVAVAFNWNWLEWELEEFWDWCKPRIKLIGAGFRYLWENPAVVALALAWIGIALGLKFFSYDIYELYGELHRQIDKKGLDADEYRGIAIRYFGIVAGAGALIGYIMVTARNIIANKQNKINEQQRITESMGQAIAQMGAFNGDKPHIEVRLGGLYSLQRIMQDSQKDEMTIAKILYAYIRENAKRDRTGQPRQKGPTGHSSYQVPEDIQAALGIIIQFSKKRIKQGKDNIDDNYENQLDLSFTDFSEYFLVGLDFKNSILHGANLSGADLFDANISYSDLSSAKLSKTNLYQADLCNTVLKDANLSGANLTGTNLSQTVMIFANLSKAKFLDTNVVNAALLGVQNLTQKQVNKADGNRNTVIPKGLKRPKDWEDNDEY